MLTQGNQNSEEEPVFDSKMKQEETRFTEQDATEVVEMEREPLKKGDADWNVRGG